MPITYGPLSFQFNNTDLHFDVETFLFVQLKAANQSESSGPLFPWNWLLCHWILRRQHIQLTERPKAIMLGPEPSCHINITIFLYPKCLCSETLACNNQVSKTKPFQWNKKRFRPLFLCLCFSLSYMSKNVKLVQFWSNVCLMNFLLFPIEQKLIINIVAYIADNFSCRHYAIGSKSSICCLEFAQVISSHNSRIN